MLYTLTAVKDNLRNRDGKRVFYLGKGDQLTSEAKDFLAAQRIEILPAEQARPERYRLLSGGYVEEKPEHMTHLSGDILVEKTHPRIAFRGAVDTLESELLLAILELKHLEKPLTELLTLSRNLLRWEVLNEPAEETNLSGLTETELRSRSHFPQKYYGIPHFMPEPSDGKTILTLNKLRALVRATERAAALALPDRADILKAFNRMSSFLYILMLQEKSKK
jgi:ethanolamine utilization cobalamin adenosyltransferase